jgi:cytochrome c oxidase subunit 1
MANPAVASPHHAPAAHGSSSGLWSWLTTVDHKKIGVLYGVSALFFFVIGGLEALVIRAQLFNANAALVSAEWYNAMFTMHGTTMVFLVVMPLSAAFFNFLVPLQIGARDVAFPRLNAFSYWLFFCGAVVLNLPFLLSPFVEQRVVPDGGWFGYVTLTGKTYSPGASIDFWICGLQILGIASMAAGFNFIVTILNMRAPGMNLLRMPVFTWMTFVVQFLVVLSFPCITVALIFLMMDRTFGTHFYVPEGGGDPILWQHLFWLFGHPEVYILILPAMGIVSEILPTFSRKPLFGAPFVIFSGITIGLLGFGVWAHHMYTTGMGAAADAGFSVTTMLIAIPTGVKIFNWMATLWGGQIRMTTAMYYATAFVGMFTMGGLSGIMHSSSAVDLQHQDSYFVVAHFHYVLFGGAIMGLLGGIYFWFPKLTGKMMDESAGKLSFWIILGGFNLTFFPMHIVGAWGMPRRTWTYLEGLGWEFVNRMETVGAFTIAIGVGLFLINLIRSARNGEKATDNPWDAATLEWAIPSPPPEHNFDKTPTVYSERPVWEKNYGPGPGYSLPTGDEHIHLPPPSIKPAISSLGAGLILFGLVVYGALHNNMGVAVLPSLSVTFIGLAMMLYGFYTWLMEPGHD